MTIRYNEHEYLMLIQDQTRPASIAVIIEKDCIGCTKCIQACPVDSIIGTAKQMHVVLTEECVGCNLCVEPCPVDCIEMQAIPEFHYSPERAQQRYHKHQARMQQQNVDKLQAQRQQAIRAKQKYIQAALQRVQKKREA